MARLDIRLSPGERGLIIGQTGSGKSFGAAWMARHAEQRVIIMDTKHEPLFDRLPKPGEEALIVSSVAEMLEAVKRKKGAEYIIVRPPSTVLAEPETLDGYLAAIYEHARDVFTLIDETYTFHTNGRAHAGLIGMLTRGRSRGLTTLMGTQRPAWVSRFCLTEAQKYYVFRIADKRDWNTLSSVGPFIQRQIPKYHFLYWIQGEDESPRLMAPLPPIADLGYTPTGESRRKWL